MGWSSVTAAGHVTVDHPIGFVHYLSSSHLIGCTVVVGGSVGTAAGHVTVDHPIGDFISLALI